MIKINFKLLLIIILIIFHIFNISIATTGNLDQDSKITKNDSLLMLRNSLGFKTKNINWDSIKNLANTTCNPSNTSNSIDATLTLLFSLNLNLTKTQWCNSNNNITIGKRTISSTPLEKGTLFASPIGTNTLCLKENPCSIETAFSQLQSGDILFLRGGTYNTKSRLITDGTGTSINNIVIESYPGELAILDGRLNSADDVINKTYPIFNGIRLRSKNNYFHIRNIEIKNFGGAGISMSGTNNIIEGCSIHNNFLSGIVITDAENGYSTPYTEGYNIIRDNEIFDNSDAGLNSSHGYYANGGNSDGIAISNSKYNLIEHNNIYGNSDDGIDTWRSNNAIIQYNKVWDNGKAQGDGNGIKAGGNLDPNSTNGLETIARHNISFNNTRSGFDFNAGKNVIFKYNTAYNNKRGFYTDATTITENNIESTNINPTLIKDNHKYNSWQKNGKLNFISTDPNSINFLKPENGSPFQDMGAYASDNTINLFTIGGSTVHNYDFPSGSTFLELGWGDVLNKYSTKLLIINNQASSGASTKTYKNISRTNNWTKTKELMLKSDTTNGAFILIHFGHNDETDSLPETSTTTIPGRNNSFYNELSVFINESKNLNFTPILITPVERMWKKINSDTTKSHIKNIGDYPQTIRFLAEDTDTQLLDLQNKSWTEFNTYIDSNDIMNTFSYDDHTHFNPQGATIIAGWVKDLACDLKDKSLCDLFKKY